MEWANEIKARILDDAMTKEKVKSACLVLPLTTPTLEFVSLWSTPSSWYMGMVKGVFGAHQGVRLFKKIYRNAELPFHHECRQPTCCLPISPSSFLSYNNKSFMGVPQSSISVLGLIDAFVSTLCPSFSLCLPIVLGFSFSSLHALLPFLWVLFLYWSQHLLLSFPVTFRGTSIEPSSVFIHGYSLHPKILRALLWRTTILLPSPNSTPPVLNKMPTWIRRTLPRPQFHLHRHTYITFTSHPLGCDSQKWPSESRHFPRTQETWVIFI